MSEGNPVDNTITWLKNMTRNVVEVVEMAQAMTMVDCVDNRKCPICERLVPKYEPMFPRAILEDANGLLVLDICNNCYNHIVYGR